jgi:putative endonuclease
MYYLYIIECSDKTFYTGICVNLEKRIAEHNSSNLGAKYTFSRRPVKLVFSKEFKDCSAASKEEARIKKLTRAGKLSFLDTLATNPSLEI